MGRNLQAINVFFAIIGIILALFALCFQVFIAYNTISDTDKTPYFTSTPSSNSLSTPIPTANVLSVSSRLETDALGDMWLINGVVNNYNVGDILIVYNGDLGAEYPIEKPNGLVMVVLINDDYLTAQVILEDPDSPVSIGDRVNDNIELIDLGHLIPAYEGAAGYVSSGSGNLSIVYIKNSIPKPNIGDVFIVIAPLIRDGRIVDYFTTNQELRVVGLGLEGIAILVSPINKTAEPPDDGSLVIVSNSQHIDTPVSTQMPTSFPPK